jgi:hypothetical protein
MHGLSGFFGRKEWEPILPQTQEIASYHAPEIRYTIEKKKVSRSTTFGRYQSRKGPVLSVHGTVLS